MQNNYKKEIFSDQDEPFSIKSPPNLGFESCDEDLWTASQKEQYQSNSTKRPKRLEKTKAPWEQQQSEQYQYEKIKENPINSKGKVLKKTYKPCNKIHQNQEKAANYNPNQYKREKIPKCYPATEDKKKQFNKKWQNRGQELYPCSFCNQQMTLEQMDQHHKICQMAFQCELCFDYFPLALVEDHAKCCNKRKDKKPANRQKYQKPWQYKETSFKSRLRRAEQAKNEQNRYMNKGYHTKVKDTEQESRSYQRMLFQQYGFKHADHDQFHPPYKQYHQRHYLTNQYFSYGQDSQRYENNISYPKKEKSSVQGLDQKEIKKLPIDVFKKSESQQEQCSICTKQQQEGDLVIRLPCFHTFHQECLLPWLKMKSICPKCKHNLKSQ